MLIRLKNEKAINIESIFLFINLITLAVYEITRKEELLIILLLEFSYLLLKGRIKIKFTLYEKRFLYFFIYYILISLVNLLIMESNNSHYDFLKNQIFVLALRVFIVLNIYIIIKSDNFNLIKFFNLIKYIGIVLCIIGVYEYVYRESLSYHIFGNNERNWQITKIGTDYFRVFTFFMHPIVYGMFLIVLFWMIKFLPLKNFYINKIYQLLILINLYATKSRSSWIGLIITIFFYLIINKNIYFRKINKKKFLSWFLIINLTLIMFFVYRKNIYEALTTILQRFQIVLQEDSMDGSRTQRLGAIKNIIEFEKNNPLSFLFGRGVGYGTVFMINNPVNVGFNIVDNQFFTIILECGIIGLMLFIIPCLRILTLLIKCEKNTINNISGICLLGIYVNIFFYDALTWYVSLFLISLFIFAFNFKSSNKKV